MDADSAFQPRPSFVDKIEPHVCGARRRAVAAGCFRRELDRGVGHCVLGRLGLSRHGLHAVAIAVARDEIHSGIHFGRIGPKRLLGDAHRLDKFSPIHRAQEAQAADTIADGDLIGRLCLIVRPLQLLARQALFGETVFHPAMDGRQRGTVALQSSAEFLHELVAKRRIGPGQLRQNIEDRFRRVLQRNQQAVSPHGGQIPIAPPLADVCRHPPQVFDEPQPQHDRHGPKFTKRQRRDRLVCGNEVRNVFRIHTAVHMGDQLQGNAIDARKARRRPFQQTRQLTAVGPRQMQTRHTDLLFDKVKVIQQPFTRQCNATTVGLRAGHQIVRLDDDAFIILQPQQQAIRPVLRVDLMTFRQRDGMPLQLFPAEQLRAQRRLVCVWVPTRPPGSPGAPA